MFSGFTVKLRSLQMQTLMLMFDWHKAETARLDKVVIQVVQHFGDMDELHHAFKGIGILIEQY